MKLEKEIYINDYEFDCFDGSMKYDIVEFYRENYFTNEERKFITKNCGKKMKLTLEVEEPILDEVERKYLSGVIKPFRDRITFIALEDIDDTELLQMIIYYDDNIAYFTLPPFKIGTMYKKLELNKEYTLKELGL